MAFGVAFCALAAPALSHADWPTYVVYAIHLINNNPNVAMALNDYNHVGGYTPIGQLGLRYSSTARPALQGSWFVSEAMTQPSRSRRR